MARANHGGIGFTPGNAESAGGGHGMAAYGISRPRLFEQAALARDP